ncbi:MAG: EamA family transporter [Alphaproteobacteria bacterium]|nr:EamA family transporter [Alphaproteobacteria bacterium]
MTAAWIPSAIIVILGGIGIHIFSRFTKDFPDPYLGGLVAHGVAFIVVAGLFLLFSGFETSAQITRKDWLYVILTGICIGIANLFVIVMYKQGAPVSTALPLTRVSVIVGGGILGLFLFSEVLSFYKAAGMLLSILSIYLLMK